MLTTLPSVSSLKLSSSPCLGPPATSFVTTQYSGLWRYEGILRDITRYVSTCRAACPHPRAGRTRPRWRGRTRSRRTPGSRYTCSQSPQPEPRMLKLNSEGAKDYEDPVWHLDDDPLPGQHGLGREHIAVTVLVLVPPRQPPPLHQSEVSIQYPPITAHLTTILLLWTNQR